MEDGTGGAVLVARLPSVVAVVALPLNVPPSVTPVALFVITAAGNCARGITPLTWLTGSVPDKPPAVPARMAYGVGVNGCRGVSVTKPDAPLVRTAISSQRALPVNTPEPKSNVTVNRPLVTGVAAFVRIPLTTLPLVTASKIVNRKS